ncbi:gliding motility protein GldC [Sphingobacteriales bacterium UPWRP_1]|nr:gliding motility protein GldC [Sphingobacteriales bacterium UPWRP_1]
MSEITFSVGLNDNNIPVSLQWDADDHPVKGKKTCKSVLIALWDGDTKNTLRIDLWTKDMEVNEMNHFFFQTLMTMSDTFERATANTGLSQKMREFARQFAAELQLKPPTTGGK